MFLAIKRGNGIAGRSNAKPLFLLSVIECISLHKLNENKIMWDDEEIEKSYHAFAGYYEQDNKSSIIVPYYHLSTAPFFHLVWIDEKNRPPMNRKTPSEKYLRENLVCAYFDDELWKLLNDAECREFLRRNIIERFLSN